MDFDRLIELLQEKAAQEEKLGEFELADEYLDAAIQVQAWLDGGGPEPVEIERYAHLLTEDGKTDDAVDEIVESVASSEDMVAANPSSEDPVEQSLDDITPETLHENDDVAKANGDSPDLHVLSESRDDDTEEPESQEHKRQLAEARQNLEKGLAGDIEALLSARIIVEFLETASLGDPEIIQLQGQIAEAIRRQVESAKKEGDRLREAGELEAARNQYRLMQRFEDSEHARNAILEIDREEAKDFSAGDLARLKRDLRNRKDLEKLHNAVYEAEMRQSESKLPAELEDLLGQARPALDALRQQYGIMTTMARLGNLAARKKARDDLQKELGVAEQVFDPIRNEYVPTRDAVREANAWYREKSDELVQHELGRVERMLPAHPTGARDHLQHVLRRYPPEEGQEEGAFVIPFEESTVQALETKLIEVEEMVRKHREAKDRLRDAEDTEDEIAVLRILLEAHSIWPDLPGLESRLAQARRTAKETLLLEIGALHNSARGKIDLEAYDEALETISKADQIPTKWPEEQLPDELASTRDESRNIRELVIERRKNRAAFNELDKSIRELVLDDDRRAEGMSLFAQVKDDTRFHDLTDLQLLETYVSQYKDVGERLADARSAMDDRDWKAVSDIARALLDEGQAGDWADELREMLAFATVELRVKTLEENLEAKRVGEARHVLNELLRDPDSGRVAALKERLAPQIEVIKEAEIEKTMPDLYQQALELQGRPDLASQIKALLMFRHIAGKSVDEPDSSWSPYKLSLVTDDAQLWTNKLRARLRNDQLPTLTSLVLKARSDEPVDEHELADMADRAAYLRQAFLLETTDEQQAVDWLILHQGRKDAVAFEEAGDWDKAVEKWRSLDIEFPRRVRESLREARIQQALAKADRLLGNGENDAALSVLQDALAEPDLEQSSILLFKQADVYAAMGQFDDAFEAVRRVSTIEIVNEQILKAKQRDLEHEQAVQQAINKAQQQREDNPLEALRTVRGALADPMMSNSSRLRLLQRDIYRETSKELLAEADSSQADAGLESKIRAVVALVDLNTVEDLVDLPQDQRRAADRLKQVEDLEPSVIAVTDRAARFDFTTMSLQDAIEEANELSSRMQAFIKVLPLLNVTLSRDTKELLEHDSRNLGKLLDDLRDVQEVLARANDAELWRQALLRDNFGELDGYLRQARDLSPGYISDVEEFEERLTEWKALHDYLSEAIRRIRQDFIGGRKQESGSENEAIVEDFPGVLREIRLLKVRPDVRPDNNKPWRQITEENYSDIYQQMGAKLVVQDLYESGTLVGWRAVERAAAERQEQLEIWTDWERSNERLMDEATRKLETAQSNNKRTTPLVKQRADWQALVEAADHIIENIDRPPRVLAVDSTQTAENPGEADIHNGQEVPIRSRRAELVKERARGMREYAQKMIVVARTEMPSGNELVFPSGKEFDRASRTGRFEALNEVVTRAEEIGWSNEAEEKLLVHYRDKVLPKMPKQKVNSSETKSPFWDRIRGR